MISRTMSAELPGHIGKHVTIAGWLHRRRELKSCLLYTSPSPRD